MKRPPRSIRAAAWAAVFILLLATVAPAAARQRRSGATGSCSHPCEHVDDCPKVTCECTNAVASSVAACDAVKTHCCTSARTACARFCEAHDQKWTGKFTPEPADGLPSTGNASDDTNSPDSHGASTGTSSGASSNAPAASCEEPCDKPEDCRAMTCKCTRSTAANVAACDEHTHCCGSARIVCEHFCGAKKQKWTGKVVAASPPPPASSLDEPNDGGDRDGDDGYYLQP